jgi:hypothetical protein
VDDVTFRLQLSVGDVNLPMGDPFKFPSIEVPANSAWYLLDAGEFSIPNVALRHTGPGVAPANAKNVLQASLFVQHKFTTATTIKLDVFYLFATNTWLGKYKTFRETYDTGYNIDQNNGVLFDSLGPETIVAQTQSAYTEAVLNPYADPGGSEHLRLVANKTCFVFAVPSRGVTALNDCLVHVLTDTLVSRARVAGMYEALAVA